MHSTMVNDWTSHWSNERQVTLSQRFFSFYRKAVFAYTVAFFANRYFPTRGLFLEAGSGTSETSLKIDKVSGGRVLVALDIILPVLKQIHPVMDEAMCGDIFHLPFRDGSVDGIWNVGVMEHFTSAQIDSILSEFHRVLKNDAPLVLLWPGKKSIPQRLLRLAEKVINHRREGSTFRFHPPEISQLTSAAEGRLVLARNGFQTVEVDPGPRSLMAFITLVGVKNGAHQADS